MNRHDTDVLSLTFGLVFAAVVGGWLLLRWVSVAALHAGWLLASVLIILGVLGILTTVCSSRHREPDHTDQQIPPATR